MALYPAHGSNGRMSSATRDISMMDLSGRIVKSWKNYRGDNLMINGINTGVYMLLVTNKMINERQTYKIVILE